MIEKIKKLLKPVIFPKKKVGLTIHRDMENEIFFCAAGEWGFEIMSWIPYLLFIKQKTGIKLNTISRPGSKVFYYFSDSHTELLPEEISNVWGDKKKYLEIKKRLGIKEMVYVCNEYIRGGLDIIINEYKWNVKDVHAHIDEKTSFSKPDFSNISSKLPFNFTRPFVIINNKYATEWVGNSPINFFSRTELIELRDNLIAKGYSVVYNRFIEQTNYDTFHELKDSDIFTIPNCYDMRNFYNKEKSPEIRNVVQISMYNKASFIFCIQGGNVYLPAICGRKIFMLMKKGDYIDYTELSRIYNLPNIEVFYENRHLLNWIDNHLILNKTI